MIHFQPRVPGECGTCRANRGSTAPGDEFEHGKKQQHETPSNTCIVELGGETREFPPHSLCGTCLTTISLPNSVRSLSHGGNACWERLLIPIIAPSEEEGDHAKVTRNKSLNHEHLRMTTNGLVRCRTDELLQNVGGLPWNDENKNQTKETTRTCGHRAQSYLSMQATPDAPKKLHTQTADSGQLTSTRNMRPVSVPTSSSLPVVHRQTSLTTADLDVAMDVETPSRDGS